MMSMMFIFLPRAAVAGGRIADVLETELAITDPKEPQQFREPFSSEIEFRDVCFRYPDALDDVLHNISFTARPGETTAFIGSTGSGKSTVVNLIPRFSMTEGAILPTDRHPPSAKRSADKTAAFPWGLFLSTIESNPLYADDGGPETLREAAEIARPASSLYRPGF